MKHAVEIAEKAALKYDCEMWVPQFPEGIEGTDFNDLHKSAGLDEIKRQFENNRYRPKPEATEEPADNEPVQIDTQKRHNCNVVCLDSVIAKPLEWIWEKRIPRGKFIVVGGKPGQGKTQISLAIAATITTGGQWPDSAGCATIGDVIILSAEDDPADTLKPRLVAASADVKRVHILESVEEVSQDGEKVIDRQFNMSRHIPDLEALLKVSPETVLIIIDPISAYIGVKDSHKDSDVREVLGPLSQLAAEYRVAIIGIVHLNKSMNPDPMARFMGSTAVVAAARVAFLVHGDSDSDEKLFLPVKSNLAKPVPGLTYKIIGIDLPGGINTSRVEWTGETDKQASDVLTISRLAGQDTTALTGAKEWLLEILSDGPLPASEVKTAAKNTPYTPSKIRRAADAIGIKSIKRGQFYKSKWYWMTPEQAANLKAAREGFSEGDKL